jgi:hypothetical protein
LHRQKFLFLLTICFLSASFGWFLSFPF